MLKISLIVFFTLLIGLVIPKLIIKNPDASSSPCLNAAYGQTPKLPESIIKTPAIKEISRTEVRIKFYTIFAIKIPQERMIFCTLAN